MLLFCVFGGHVNNWQISLDYLIPIQKDLQETNDCLGSKKVRIILIELIKVLKVLGML